VLGSLFNYLKETGLDKTTYVMVMSDNGSALMREERGTSGAVSLQRQSFLIMAVVVECWAGIRHREPCVSSRGG
jgi:arylsulfatase A-like enzyme